MARDSGKVTRQSSARCSYTKWPGTQISPPLQEVRDARVPSRARRANGSRASRSSQDSVPEHRAKLRETRIGGRSLCRSCATSWVAVTGCSFRGGRTAVDSDDSPVRGRSRHAAPRAVRPPGSTGQLEAHTVRRREPAACFQEKLHVPAPGQAEPCISVDCDTI